MKKWVCPVCGYVHEGENPPAECPVCHVSGEKFTLQAEEESLTLTLPKGWMDEHYLRASELRLEVERQQKMGWPTRVQEA